ncbi:hypothetical protein [Caulobacter flavus]|uniref:hypothetical protein n=1 Tax=Caulobacter flavus TaxID=1679497 RepID=UPI0011AF5E38|nr:hypothetical protein [Caulobacter flavus]
MRRLLLTGLTLLAGAAALSAQAGELDLRGDYAHRRCHGQGDAGEGLSIGQPGREAKAIAASQGRVKRSGPLLTLGKLRLKTKAIEGDAEDEAEYEYLGGWVGSGLEVVFVMRYEDMAWRVVDPRSGEWFDMGGPPLASPGGKAIAAVGDDSLINEFNGVEIVEHRDGKFESQSIDTDYACDPVWLSDDVLQLKVLSPKYRDRNGELLAGELKPSAWRTTQVVRKNGVWTLVPPKP